jgi:uncharacterized protein YegP (UPF0339 family)
MSRDLSIDIIETRTLLGRQRWHAVVKAGNYRNLFTSEKYWNETDAEGAASLLKGIDENTPIRHVRR